MDQWTNNSTCLPTVPRATRFWVLLSIAIRIDVLGHIIYTWRKSYKAIDVLMRSIEYLILTTIVYLIV